MVSSFIERVPAARRGRNTHPLTGASTLPQIAAAFSFAAHPDRIVVGSGTGATIRRQPLGRIRGFPLRARVEVAVIRFQSPPHRTQHADLPHYALLHRFTARVMKPCRVSPACPSTG